MRERRMWVIRGQLVRWHQPKRSSVGEVQFASHRFPTEHYDRSHLGTYIPDAGRGIDRF
jgi:hypothetical protein